MTWGLFTASLLFALTISTPSIAIWSCFVSKLANLNRMLLFLVVYVVGIINWPGMDISLAAYIWSVLADLSMATFLFISYHVTVLLFADRRIASYQPVSLALVVIILSMIYYPLVLGFGSIDVYSWGLNSPFLIAIIGIASLALSFTGYGMLALWGGFTLFAWASDIGESVNIFDYLLDPVAFFWSIYIAIRHWSFRYTKITAFQTKATRK